MTWALLVFLIHCGYVCSGCYDLGFASFPYLVWVYIYIYIYICLYILVFDVSCTSFTVPNKSFLPLGTLQSKLLI